MKRFSVFCLQLGLALLLVLPMGALSASSSVAAEAYGRGWHWGYRHGWDSRASSEFARITGWAREPRGDGYAIIIGISDYLGDYSVLDLDDQGNPMGYDLFYADDDAVTMANTLVDVYEYSPGHIALLLGQSGLEAAKGEYGEEHFLMLELATHDNIMKAIGDVRKKVKWGDEVVFFFAGHGLQVETGRLDGDRERIDEAILDCNLQPILDGQLARAFRWFRTNRIVFMFDCCNAGGMTDLARGGRIVLMACAEDGIALEYGEPYSALYPVPPELLEEMGGYPNHGLFTYFFAVLGMQLGFADFYDHDGNGEVGEPGDVTIEEAFNFASGSLQVLSEYMSVFGLEQQPRISDRFGGDLLP